MLLLMVFTVEKMTPTTATVQAECALCDKDANRVVNRHEHDKLRWLMFDHWLKEGHYLNWLDKGIQEVYYQLSGSGENLKMEHIEQPDDPHYPHIVFHDGRMLKIHRSIEKHLLSGKTPVKELFEVKNKLYGRVLTD